MQPFRIARIRGVDVIGDVSVFALGALLAWVIFLDLRAPGVDVGETTALVLGVFGGLLFLATVLLHELSHTVVAQRHGIEVSRIRLMIFGGASEIPERSLSARSELAVAAAGPGVSAVVGGVLLWIGMVVSGGAGAVLRFVGLANLALAVFNLLPGLPLDGGRVLRSLVWSRTGDRDRGTQTALKVGRFTGLAIIGLGAYLLLRGTLGAIGLWAMLVGWFLVRSTSSSARGHQLERATRDKTVGDLMRPIREAVPAERNVAEALELYQIGPRLQTLAVEEAGRVTGLLGRAEVEAVAAEARATTTVGAAMTRIGPSDVMGAETPLLDALVREAGPTRHIVVVEAGRVVGLIGHAEVSHLLAEPDRD